MNIKKYSWLAALPMIFTACQDDVLVENQPQGQMIYSLSANVNGGNAKSRAQIQLNNPLSGEEFFYWNEKDSFLLYQNAYDDIYNMRLSVFNIADDYTEPADGSAVAATFHTKNPAFCNLDYYAVYPYSTKLGTNERLFKFEIDNNSQTTGLYFSGADPKEVWSQYFRNNMFMMEKGNFQDLGNASVSFKHLCSLARVTYINMTEKAQELYSASLMGVTSSSGTRQDFGSTLTYDVLDDSAWANGPSASVYTKYLTVQPGDTIDFYILFFPLAFTQDDDIVRVTVDGYPTGNRSIDLTVGDIKAANPNDTAFVAGKRYWFKVTDTPDSFVWTKDYNKANSNVTFTDKAFSKALYQYLEVEGNMQGTVTFDADSCAIMTPENVAMVKELNFSGSKYNLTTLDGIENFKNLEKIRCFQQPMLASCDLSKNTALTDVYFQYVDLPLLDLSKNTDLILLTVCNSNITSLDLRNNFKLSGICCNNNPNLNSFDISNCSDLTSLLISENDALTSVVIPNPARIGQLEYSYTNVSFDLGEFMDLRTLRCAGHPAEVAKLTSSMKKKLGAVDFSDCDLESLDLSEFGSLTYFSCSNNRLTTLNLESCPGLISLDCSGNQLTGDWDLSNFTQLKDFFVYNNELTSINLSGLSNLSQIRCNNNHLTRLDVSASASIAWIDCGNQTDANGNEVELQLKLADSLHDQWNNNFFPYGKNQNVRLVTGDFEEEGEGETSGNTVTNGAGAENFTNQGVF